MRTTAVCLVLAVALILSACGGDDEHDPTAQRTTAPAEVATTTVLAAVGGEISLSDGTRLVIPPGALPADLQVALSKEGSPPPAEDWVAALSAPVHVDLHDQTLLQAAKLELPYDKSLLPPEAPEGAILASYFDEVNNKWVIVDGTVDPSRGVVVLKITHASWWQPWTWDWGKWVTALTQLLDLKVTSLLDAVTLLTEPCAEAGDRVSVVNPGVTMLKGCVEADTQSGATVRVVNLKSFPIGIKASGPAQGVPPQILDAGASLSFEIDTTGQPPVLVASEFTEEAMGYFIVKLLLDAMPFADLVPSGAYRPIADKILEQQFIAPAIVELLRKDGLGAAEEIIRMLNEDSFLNVFVSAVTDYGTQNNISVLAKLTKAGAKSVLLAITATNVIFKSTDFIANYFFNNQTRVEFRWPRALATATPLPPHSCISVDGYPTGWFFRSALFIEGEVAELTNYPKQNLADAPLPANGIRLGFGLTFPRGFGPSYAGLQPVLTKAVDVLGTPTDVRIYEDMPSHFAAEVLVVGGHLQFLISVEATSLSGAEEGVQLIPRVRLCEGITAPG